MECRCEQFVHNNLDKNNTTQSTCMFCSLRLMNETSFAAKLSLSCNIASRTHLYQSQKWYMQYKCIHIRSIQYYNQTIQAALKLGTRLAQTEFMRGTYTCVLVASAVGVVSLLCRARHLSHSHLTK